MQAKIKTQILTQEQLEKEISETQALKIRADNDAELKKLKDDIAYQKEQLARDQDNIKIT